MVVEYWYCGLRSAHRVAGGSGGSFAGLRATYRSLAASGELAHFDFFILSDSRDPEVWLAEREADGSLDRLRARFFGAPQPHALTPGLARVTDLIGRRLMLMPAVAWAKQAAGRPIEDPPREAVVEKAAARAAREANLDEAAYMELVRAQFAAAKLAQRAAAAGATSHAGRSPEEGIRELTQVLRPAIDRLDRAILAELSRLDPVSVPVDDLVAALRADAPVPGLDEETLRPLAEAVSRLAASHARKEPASSQR